MEKKRGIKSKIVLSVVIVTTMIISVMALIVYLYFRNVLLENALEDAKQKSWDIAEELVMIEEQMEYIADYIITDAEVETYTNVDYTDTPRKINNAIYDMSSVLTRFVVINEYLSGILLMRDDGVIFSNDRELNNEYTVPYVENLLAQNLYDEGDRPRFTTVHEIYANNNRTKKQKVITYIARYKNLNDYRRINYLMLTVPYDKIIELVQPNESEFDKVVLLNGENELYYGESLESPEVYSELLNDEQMDSLEDSGAVYLKAVSSSGNWKVMVTIAKTKLLSTISPIMLSFLIVMVLGIAVIFTVLIPILTNITKPIEALTRGMDRVSAGDYDTQIVVGSGDELEALADGFNKMTEKIQISIEESIRYEKTKRKLQMDLLMNQINPHFIYNTLNSITYCSRQEDRRGVSEITNSLIHILQDSVKIGKDSIQDIVSVELEIVRNYMNIQKYRYPEKFEFMLNCDPLLLDKYIPKMIIQPLVENSLFHGICLSEEKGTIYVGLQSIKKQDKAWLELCVEDSGVGMTLEIKEKLFETRPRTKGSNQTRSIGMRNIKERLEFIYGEHHQLDIWSEQGKGTRITITFPVE